MNEQFYSQFSEDQWIAANFSLPERGTFAEIGAFDGRLCSNTLWLENRGWTGYCVEPDQLMAAEARKNRKCPVLACAISSMGRRQLLKVNRADRGMSGLMVEKFDSQVPVLTMTFEEAQEIMGISHLTLASVDTEGTEIDVLANIGCWPSILIVEFLTMPSPPRDDAIRAFMPGHMVQVYKSPANLIFYNTQAIDVSWLGPAIKK